MCIANDSWSWIGIGLRAMLAVSRHLLVWQLCAWLYIGMALPHTGQFNAMVVDKVNQVKNSNMELNVKCESILKTFEENSITYKIQETATAFFVHPKNRAGLLVNPMDCHAKGFSILKVGAKKALLEQNSLCFEMARTEAKRLSQTEVNKSVINASGGLLPCPTGQEKYLTVSEDHGRQHCHWALVFARAVARQGLVPPLCGLDPQWLELVGSASPRGGAVA